jgi:predicted dehydrogenase
VQPRFIEVHRLSAFKPRAIDVSVVQDLMIHDIDLLLWLTGSAVVDIQATGVSVLTPTPDICNARLTFANGCVANVTASRISAKPMRKLRIFQENSYASVDMGAGTIEMFRLIETPSFDASYQTPLGTINTQFGDRMIVVDSPSVLPQNAIAEEQRRFLESIRTGASAAVTLSDGIEAVRIASRIEEAILSSRH